MKRTYEAAVIFDGSLTDEQLAKEQTRMILYCSEVGITLALGETVFHEQGGCISASLLWPL